MLYRILQTRAEDEMFVCVVQHGREYCKVLVLRMDVNVRIRRKS